MLLGPPPRLQSPTRSNPNDPKSPQAIAAQRQEDIAEEFAKFGVRWRVEDARAAGIHPLAALGAQIHQAPQLPVFSESGSESAPFGELFRSGQDIMRAVMASAPNSQREETLFHLAVQRGELENALLASQLMKAQGQLGPPMPESAGYAPQPHKPVVTSGGKGVDPGVVNAISYELSPDGKFAAIVPSKDVKERIEDSFWPELRWDIQHQLLPFIGMGNIPPKPGFPPPRGHEWVWQQGKLGYQAMPVYGPHRERR